MIAAVVIIGSAKGRTEEVMSMTAGSTKKIRVLGVVGSPRVGGNTDHMVDEVLKGAADAGAAHKKIYLSKLSIAPCRACEGCKTQGRCIVDDDMQAVLDDLKEHDIWVLGTPVYFWGPTAWFKAMLDRFYGARDHIDFSRKSAIVVVPMEDTNIATARHTVGMIADSLAYLKTKLLASIVAPGVLNKGEVGSHQDILAEARRAGETAARTYKTSA